MTMKRMPIAYGDATHAISLERGRAPPSPGRRQLVSGRYRATEIAGGLTLTRCVTISQADGE